MIKKIKTSVIHEFLSYSPSMILDSNLKYTQLTFILASYAFPKLKFNIAVNYHVKEIQIIYNHSF